MKEKIIVYLSQFFKNLAVGVLAVSLLRPDLVGCTLGVIFFFMGLALLWALKE